ncbi:MAG: transglycosylase SLT domain-containing protein [Anaerolineae bacterium]|nr:transglycosylase SLT domain-containing protein [Anaerolineae bacterium]
MKRLVLLLVLGTGGLALLLAAFLVVRGWLNPQPTEIAPLFTREVDYWAGDIERWAQEYDLDPNLLATVMQIESCGHPTVSSSAGAQGLFQVMPFHFSEGENQLDPDTNARRGAGVLKSCLNDFASGDAAMALVCYNGGPGAISQSYTQWDDQVRRYYMWGTGIYADALTNQSSSPTLDRWLNAGGGVLCQWAAAELGIG